MSRPKILNLSRVPRKFVDDPDFKSLMMTLRLGAAAGSRRLYVNIDHVKPGAKSVKYHSHSKQEEFFLILQGSGTLRLGGKKLAVKTGDFFAKPAGQGIAHQFINTGSEVLKILDCGTEETEDVVAYPDEDAVLVRSMGRVYPGRLALKKWSSDPNG
jgi:uncharacterized cupin superfamily protein